MRRISKPEWKFIVSMGCACSISMDNSTGVNTNPKDCDSNESMEGIFSLWKFHLGILDWNSVFSGNFPVEKTRLAFFSIYIPTEISGFRGKWSTAYIIRLFLLHLAFLVSDRMYTIRLHLDRSALTFSDIDECASGTHNCHGVAHCYNNAGSFTCSCREGYSGDGLTCDPAGKWNWSDWIWKNTLFAFYLKLDQGFCFGSLKVIFNLFSIHLKKKKSSRGGGGGFIFWKKTLNGTNS